MQHVIKHFPFFRYSSIVIFYESIPLIMHLLKTLFYLLLISINRLFVAFFEMWCYFLKCLIHACPNQL